MEQDNLKAAWKNMGDKRKSEAELTHILQKKKCPALRRAEKQLMIEIVAFTAFLFVYYDFFDGDRKPLYANVLLVTSMLLFIIHNVLGFFLVKRNIGDNNISESLMHQLSKVKRFAVASVICRTLAIGCLLLFFTSVIQFTPSKIRLMVVLVAIMILLLIWLSKIWANRIRQIQETIRNLSGEP